MQNEQIQFPDQSDLKLLLDGIKTEILKEVKALGNTKESAVEYKTRQEIVTKYRITFPTLYRHMRAGLFSLKIGKRRLFDPVEVEKYFYAKNGLKKFKE